MNEFRTAVCSSVLLSAGRLIIFEYEVRNVSSLIITENFDISKSYSNSHEAYVGSSVLNTLLRRMI